MVHDIANRLALIPGRSAGADSSEARKVTVDELADAAR